MATQPERGVDGVGLRGRLAGGALCVAVVTLALVPLLPHEAAGQVEGGAASQARVQLASASSKQCPLPSISAVNTETAVGSGVYTGPPAGPKGVWVQVTGSNLVGACTAAVEIGTVQQPGETDKPPDAPTAVLPSGTQAIYFTSMGNGGKVSVLLSDPTRPTLAPVVSNDNFTFLSPPVITALSTQTPAEGQLIALAGTGFSMGSLSPTAGVTYYQGPAASQTGCDAESASVTDDTHMTLTAPATYCSGSAVITIETRRDTRYPISSTNVNLVQVQTPQPIQVRALVASVLPRQPAPGTTLYVLGSGFATAGAATLSGTPLSVQSWSDRALVLGIPKNAGIGPLLLTRYDGSSFSAGTLTLGPATFTLPGIGAAAALAAAAAEAQAKPPGIFGPAGVLIAPRLGAAASPPTLTPLIAGPANYPTTAVELRVFGTLAVVVLAAAFILALAQAGRLLLYRRRSRRAACALRLAELVSEADTALQRRGRELRLGRHLRSVEVVGRSTPLGHLLLRQHLIDRRSLRESLHQHRVESRPLGEVLVSRGAASEASVWSTLGDQWGITLVALDTHWIDGPFAHRLTALDSIKHRMLAIRSFGDKAIVAMADPFDNRARLHAEQCLGCEVVPVLATPSAIRRRQEEVYSRSLIEDSISSLERADPRASARHLTTRPQRLTAAAAGVLAVLLAIRFGGSFFIGVTGCVVALYAVVVAFRTYVIVRGAKYTDVTKVSDEELDSLTDLPVYTILCPLYREAGVLPQLVAACSALDYPSSLLDVKLLLEADDTETLSVVREYPLPAFFDVVVVPAEGPRTKPKACNFGLQFARGEYVVIFDAEDIPEPDQLKKAIATFRRSDADVGCVQAKLNFYNPRQNALTSWFALEYTSWFDFFLPGLVALRMPVPLGGSSNHFPTSVLRELNAWDPNNVTEDADLGMRLHRAGYRTLLVESTTHEEANSDFVNWVKQRSRWGKGYAVSWLVQMRNPRALRKAVGWKNFLAIQLTLGGTFGVAVLNLAVWLLTLLWALAQFNFIAYLYPGAIYYVGMIELLFGNFFFLYLGVWSAQHRKSWELTRIALLAPLYWLMMSLAMLKASLQLVTKPTYWEKTVHGLFEHEPSAPDGVELSGSPAGVSDMPVSVGAGGEAS